MPSIHIRTEHNLDLTTARDRIEHLAAQLKDRLGVSYSWTGNELHINRTGANGTILVQEKAVTADIKLGIMLTSFKGQIERQLKEFLHQNLM